MCQLCTASWDFSSTAITLFSSFLSSSKLTVLCLLSEFWAIMFFASRRWKSKDRNGSRSDDSLLLPIIHCLKEKQFLTWNKLSHDTLMSMASKLFVLMWAFCGHWIKPDYTSDMGGKCTAFADMVLRVFLSKEIVIHVFLKSYIWVLEVL